MRGQLVATLMRSHDCVLFMAVGLNISNTNEMPSIVSGVPMLVLVLVDRNRCLPEQGAKGEHLEADELDFAESLTCSIFSYFLHSSRFNLSYSNLCELISSFS
jgi:hypothetical protein